MTNGPDTPEKRINADPEILAPAQEAGADERPVISALAGDEDGAPQSFSFPPEVAAWLKSSSQEYQGKAAAMLALWLDEASLGLRRNGFEGLRSVLEEKTAELRKKTETRDLQKDLDRIVTSVVGNIGRTVAANAFAAAFANFAGGSSRQTKRPDGSDEDETAKPAPTKVPIRNPSDTTGE